MQLENPGFLAVFSFFGLITALFIDSFLFNAYIPFEQYIVIAFICVICVVVAIQKPDTGDKSFSNI